MGLNPRLPERTALSHARTRDFAYVWFGFAKTHGSLAEAGSFGELADGGQLGGLFGVSERFYF